MPDPKDDPVDKNAPPIPPAEPSPEDEVENIEEEGDVLGGNFA